MKKKEKRSSPALRKKARVRHQVAFDTTENFIKTLEKLRQNKKVKEYLKGKATNGSILAHALQIFSNGFTS